MHAGIQNKAGFFEKNKVKAALRSARAVFTTCAGAGSTNIALQQYALVIIDEASQVSQQMLHLAIVCMFSYLCVMDSACVVLPGVKC